MTSSTSSAAATCSQNLSKRVRIFPFREMKQQLPCSTWSKARKPSYLNSKSQSGSSKDSLLVTGMMGCTRGSVISWHIAHAADVSIKSGCRRGTATPRLMEPWLVSRAGDLDVIGRHLSDQSPPYLDHGLLLNCR